MECGTFKENQTKSNIRNACELSVESCHLRDLVSVHMELIQQQQLIICQRDTTIKSLRAENDALQCCLQRMEQRMALLRQKEDLSGSSHIIHSSTPKPGTMSYTEPLLSPMEKLSHKMKTEASIALPKKIHLQDFPSANLSNISSETIKTKQHESHRKHKLTSTEDISEEFNNSIETSSLYFVAYYEPVAEEIEVDSQQDILKLAQTQYEVEVPSFRLKTFSNLYVIEGTEDHEDETFTRRHQKPEIEEKRRKRWDNQRLRKEQMCEKMREKEEQSKQCKISEDAVESFFPLLDDITHIEVIDKIPVTAFGQSLPYPKPESFSLPWTPKQHLLQQTPWQK